jgi:hypothetical protein
MENNLSDLHILKEFLLEKASNLSLSIRKKLLSEIDSLDSAYPFNEYEYIISHLLSEKTMDLIDYKKIRWDYIAKAINLPLFELAPRTFGDGWGQGYIKSFSKEFITPSSILDNNFTGEYDLILPYQEKNIKIEVKSSRATDISKNKKSEPPVTKALKKYTELPFNMNFQQIKPDCCDIFVFIIVWVDEIDILVLSSNDVKNHTSYNDKQHRYSVDEGQLHIKQKNLEEMYEFLVEPENLLRTIKSKYSK